MWQLVQFLGRYIIIIEFISIYLNDSKFKIQKYHLLLWLITTNIKTQFLMMMWHAMCEQGVPTLISIKLKVLVKSVHNAKTCFLQLVLCNYNV
jgi:hypothetical protein